MKLTFDDLKRIVSLHKARNLSYQELYKKYFLWVQDRQIELDKSPETKWMSNITSPVTYMICSAIYGMYQDSRISFEVYRKIKKAKDIEMTEEEEVAYQEVVKSTTNISNQIIDLIEHVYEESDGSIEFDMSVLDTIILGNGFGGIGYEKSEDEYEVTDPNTQGKTMLKEIINRPNIFRIVPLNFFTELSAPSQQKAKFNIVRKVLSGDMIKKIYKPYGVNYVEPKEEKKSTDYIEEKDWNMVLRYLIFNNMPGVTTTKNLGWANEYRNSVGSEVMHTDIWTDNSYKIGKDIHEVYEVHTDKTLQIFVDGTDLGIYARLGPWKKKPFYFLSFRDGLNGLYDMGAGMIAYNFHKVVDGFLNMRVDNDRLVGSSPLIVNSDDNYFDGMDYLQQFPGKLIKVKDVSTSIKALDLQSAGATVANNEVDLLSKTVQDGLGISGYKMGIQQKVERSKGAVDELVGSTEAAMKSFISSIARARGFIAKYITLLSIYYMDSEEIEKICGSDDLKTKLKIDELINNYTINFNIQSVTSLRERQELESLKGIYRDFAGATRPDGTPLVDQEYVIKAIIEKNGLSDDLMLSGDEAMKYMREQVERNAELKKYEQEKMPQVPLEGEAPEGMEGIVPDFNTPQETKVGAEGAPAQPGQTGGTQGGSFSGETTAPNLDGTNQFTNAI